MKRTTAAVSALVLLAASCAPEPATETAEPMSIDRAAFQAQVDEFVGAWNSGDLSGLGARVAEDAVLLAPDGDPLVGRSAILSSIAENYDPALFQQTGTVDEVASIGEFAYARGSWRLDATPAAGAGMPVMSGKWSAIYKPAGDGGWAIWRWMWNQPPGQTAEVPTAE